MKNANTGRLGFTLIELLVVVLIIGILSAVALPQYQISVGKARVSQALITLKAITDAQEIYFLANQSYADNLSQLDLEVKENDGNFLYGCSDKRYCAAMSLNNSLPNITFHLLHQPDYALHNTGVHFCETYGISGEKLARAKAICKTLGVYKEDNYYKIN